MDKRILAEYADVKEEIKDLRKRINQDRRELDKLNRETVVDSVACGKKGGKSIRTVRIEGRPTSAINRKEKALERKIARMEDLETELLEKQTEVEDYIQTIEKSETRIMFRLYYIDDMNWTQVAHRMNSIFPKKRKAYTADSCRCKHNRFLEEF